MLLAVPFIEIGGQEKKYYGQYLRQKGNLVKLFVNRQEI